MLLDENRYIVGGYYIGFDELGQFRVFGPNNHLYLGLVDIPRHKIRIDRVKEIGEADDGRVEKRAKEITKNKRQVSSIFSNLEEQNKAAIKIKGAFTTQSVNLYLPVMGDVRTLREITVDFTNELRQFLRMRESQHTLHGEAQPSRVEFLPVGKNSSGNSKFKIQNSKLIFRRDYGNFYYQSSFEFPEWVSVEGIEKPYKGFKLKVKTDIPFLLTCETNDISAYNESCVLLETGVVDFAVFGEYAERVRRFWERTKIEVEHMLCWGKTSGDRFGTVFPRDWMETAALGVGDIPPEGIDYMLKKCLMNVNEEGEGWHEDVVGEYKYKHQAAGYDLFDRKMIDIEPWYFLTLRWVTEDFWQDKEAVAALRRAARYILRRAKEQEFIIFEPLPEGEEIPEWQRRFGLERGYHSVGNWRDSGWAYKQIHPIIAPFDVSAVFYPEALRTILKFSDKLAVDKREVERLEEVWRHKKEAYRFQDYNGTTGFALALYDAWKQLRVHHLDEAYLYFLSENYTKEEVVGFARRMLDFEYFYTELGPLLVARNNEMGYTDEEYHGLVVWTKQAAFAVAGLARALQRTPGDENFLGSDSPSGVHRTREDLNLSHPGTTEGAPTGNSAALSEGKKDRGWPQVKSSLARTSESAKKLSPSESSGKNFYLTNEEKDLLRRAAKKIAENLIKAYCQLGAIPELHRDINGKAVEWGGGAGSSVQLWSAVGARRIFREYEKLVNL